MPALFVMMVILSIRSLTLPGAGEGLRFLFQPDFGKINPSSVLDAMGQTFFSLSIGMGCMITYGSYFSPKENLQSTAVQVTVIDVFISLLAGVMIFPAVFHFGIAPTEGPELVFITLPNILGQLSFANVWACIFFILLAVAALTSTISLHEVATAYIHEEYKISRKRATLYVTLGVSVFCVLSSLSFGVLKDATIFGLTFFNLLDYLTAKLLLPFGGMLICIFVGNRVDKKILKAELTNQGSVPFYFFRTYCFFIKYIAPVGIGAIFLNELGVFRWIQALF
jgi:NSS family neurotransmitter:Na+ symporter